MSIALPHILNRAHKTNIQTMCNMRNKHAKKCQNSSNIWPKTMKHIHSIQKKQENYNHYWPIPNSAF